MASLQIRDMPEEVYEALEERARRQRRSLAQQAIADLALIDELQARQRREAVIERMRMRPPQKKITDPVRLVREDRER